MYRFIGIIFLLLSFFSSSAQDVDTLRIMHYNLLNYRNTTNQCTESTNNASDKEGYLSAITSHVKPDVITVNEMGAHWLNPNKLLTNALNTNGVSYFDQAEFSNNSFSSLTNMLFYNTEKLSKYGQEVISKDKNGDELVRVIDVYHLYYNDAYGLSKGDTTFLTFIVTHLKAGSGTDDKLQRAMMTESIMSYLATNKSNHSYFLCGDFNTQTASETSYKNLIEAQDENIRFIDPNDAAGSWNNNSNYSNLHTQSTHVSDTRGGCFSGGGMDDRFDFILCGKEVINQSYRVGYIEGSYFALGQDSRRFNGDMRSPSNSLIPTSISEALYEMSDHLPVIIDVEVAKKTSGVQRLASDGRLMVKYNSESEVEFEFKPVEVDEWQVVNYKGELVHRESQMGLSSNLKILTSNMAAGVYITFIRTNQGQLLINKFIVQK